MVFREDAHDAVWWDKDNRENLVVLQLQLFVLAYQLLQ